MPRYPAAEPVDWVRPPQIPSFIRTRPLAHEWNPNNPPDGVKPTVSLFIRWYLGSVKTEDYPYRMWAEFRKHVRKSDPKAKVGSYDNFRNWIWMMTKLGLIKMVRQMEEEPAQNIEDTPLTYARRGKRDFITSWYRISNENDARAKIQSLIDEGYMAEESFYLENLEHNRMTLIDIYEMAWNNPKLVLYSHSFQHLKRMPRMGLPPEQIPKPGRPPVAVPKKVREKRKAERKARAVEGPGKFKKMAVSAQRVLVEIRLMALESEIRYYGQGGIDADEKRQADIAKMQEAHKGAGEAPDITNMMVIAEIEAARREAEMLMNTPDMNKIYRWLYETVVATQPIRYKDNKLLKSVVEQVIDLRRLPIHDVNKAVLDAEMSLKVWETEHEKKKAERQPKKKRKPRGRVIEMEHAEETEKDKEEEEEQAEEEYE